MSFSLKVYVTNVYFAMHNCWNVYLLLLILKIKIQQFRFFSLICQIPWFNIWNNYILKRFDAGQKNDIKVCLYSLYISSCYLICTRNSELPQLYWTYYQSWFFCIWSYISLLSFIFWTRLSIWSYSSAVWMTSSVGTMFCL